MEKQVYHYSKIMQMNRIDELAINFIWVLIGLMIILFYLLQRDND